MSGTEQCAEQCTELANIAYVAYGEQAQWRNFRGDPMPLWGELPEATRAAWAAAAGAVAEHVRKTRDTGTDTGREGG
jgi:hypothetical protein